MTKRFEAQVIHPNANADFTIIVFAASEAQARCIAFEKNRDNPMGCIGEIKRKGH